VGIAILIGMPLQQFNSAGENMGAPGPMKLPKHDSLSRLARDDPQEFEVLRSALIEDCISRAPERIQPRLRQLQFRVDGIRRMSRTPLAATLKIQALMWDSFLEMNEKLQVFARQSRACSPRPSAKPEATPRAVRSARVIEFQPRRTGVERLLARTFDGIGGFCP
jgi:hypothetical protein